MTVQLRSRGVIHIFLRGVQIKLRLLLLENISHTTPSNQLLRPRGTFGS
jgi:hypothetical protein